MEQRVRQEVSNRIGNAVRGSDAILRESDRDTCVVLPGADARGGRARRPAPRAPGQRRLPRGGRAAAGGGARRRGGASRTTGCARRSCCARRATAAERALDARRGWPAGRKPCRVWPGPRRRRGTSTPQEIAMASPRLPTVPATRPRDGGDASARSQQELQPGRTAGSRRRPHRPRCPSDVANPDPGRDVDASGQPSTAQGGRQHGARPSAAAG